MTAISSPAGFPNDAGRLPNKFIFHIFIKRFKTFERADMYKATFCFLTPPPPPPNESEKSFVLCANFYLFLGSNWRLHWEDALGVTWSEKRMALIISPTWETWKYKSTAKDTLAMSAVRTTKCACLNKDQQGFTKCSCSRSIGEFPNSALWIIVGILMFFNVWNDTWEVCLCTFGLIKARVSKNPN